MASNASAMNHIKVTFIPVQIFRRICNVETASKVLARAIRAREESGLFSYLQLGGIYLGEEIPSVSWSSDSELPMT